jgi:hypothetical protein
MRIDRYSCCKHTKSKHTKRIVEYIGMLAPPDSARKLRGDVA